jgi:hypothetical protein
MKGKYLTKVIIYMYSIDEIIENVEDRFSYIFVLKS